MSEEEPADEPFGYLLVHFRDEPGGERIYLSLTEGDDPLRWRPLFGGEPILESTVGTRGVRDPVLARDAAGRYHILATDLRIEDGDGDWASWVRHGSRRIVVWDSADLLAWSPPRLVEVAPPTAGMAWAPEVTTDAETGEAIVFWSSRLYGPDDPEHLGESYSRILFARTRDFHTFSPAQVLVDADRDIIDTAVLQDDGYVVRISKDEDRAAGSLRVYQEVGTSLFSDDYRMVASRIGADQYGDVEAPIIIRDRRAARWYLFLDQYSQRPQGYFAMETDDILSGGWTRVPPDRFTLRPGTKHGGVLPLTRAEWERLEAEQHG